MLGCLFGKRIRHSSSAIFILCNIFRRDNASPNHPPPSILRMCVCECASVRVLKCASLSPAEHFVLGAPLNPCWLELTRNPDPPKRQTPVHIYPLYFFFPPIFVLASFTFCCSFVQRGQRSRRRRRAEQKLSLEKCAKGFPSGSQRWQGETTGSGAAVSVFVRECQLETRTISIMERIEEVIECTRQGRKARTMCLCVGWRGKKYTYTYTYIYKYIYMCAFCTWRAAFVHIYVHVKPPTRPTTTKSI